MLNWNWVFCTSQSKFYITSARKILINSPTTGNEELGAITTTAAAARKRNEKKSWVCAVWRTAHTKYKTIGNEETKIKKQNKKSPCIFYNHAPFPLNLLKRFFLSLFTVYFRSVSMRSGCFNSFMQQICFIYSAPTLNTKLIGWKKKSFAYFTICPSSSRCYSWWVYFYEFFLFAFFVFQAANFISLRFF